MSNRVTVIYKHFFPGFRAGGPIQSLVNMIIALSPRYRFSVITSAYDLNSKTPYNDVELDTWTSVGLNENVSVQTYYSTSPDISKSSIRQLLHQTTPDVVFVNGLFTSWATAPLGVKGDFPNARFIVSARGMLQPGALRVKSAKKRIYLLAHKLLKTYSGVHWHATNRDERDDIIRVFGPATRVNIAHNMPRKPVETFVPARKQPGALSLVYVSLISEKKNVLLLLKVLRTVKSRINLQIFGPVKDEAYWQRCEHEITGMPAHVKVAYRREVAPQHVQKCIAEHDAFILLTQGENFGHALYEALGSGRPIITSKFTPWNDLEKSRAGWNVDIGDPQQIAKILDEIASLDGQSFTKYCKGAQEYASRYYADVDFEHEYKLLFS